MDRYPEESSQVKMGTVAYHAERELDTLMYQDTGMYRNMQYGKANIISLQTMYEEIKILWDQELKYRFGQRITTSTGSLAKNLRNNASFSFWHPPIWIKHPISGIFQLENKNGRYLFSQHNR